MRSDRRGSALVETALVFLALVITIVGIFDFGQLLFFHQTFRERVLAGVRYAVVDSSDAQQIRNPVVHNSPIAPPGNPRGLFGLTTATVTVTRYDSPLLAGASLYLVFRVVMPVEGLGAID